MINEIKYYDIRDDLNKYPDAWAYLVWSARGPGKTYSSLRMCIEDKKKFVFMKRTIEDVKLLCSTKTGHGFSFDISPFVPLNRDFGWSIKPVPIVKGIAGFYNCDEEGMPFGNPVGYCAALSAAKDIKGFDLSECDYMIFDEFIPRKHERVNRSEGDQMLDIYMTIARDRTLRGRGELKLLCLANATSVNNPVFMIFDVVDVAVSMDVINAEYVYQSDRGIMLHKIPTRKDETQKTGIEKAMAGSAWADMAFSGSFAYDDFTAVGHRRIKGYKLMCAYIYKKEKVYIYGKDGYYYSCNSGNDKGIKIYDLNRENEQKRFYYDFVQKLRTECINDRFIFEKYTQYDLIINYKKIFNL